MLLRAADECENGVHEKKISKEGLWDVKIGRQVVLIMIDFRVSFCIWGFKKV
jgi:hypothetical protein